MKKFDSTDIALILANCIPLIGVLFFDWSIFSVLVGYWVETLVITFFALVRLIYIYKITAKPSFILGGVLFILPGFIFMCGHFIGIIALYSEYSDQHDFFVIINDLIRLTTNSFFVMFASLFLSHGYSFVYNFLGNKEKRGELLNLANNVIVNKKFNEKNNDRLREKVFGNYYTRIIFMHLIVVFGSFVMVLSHSTTNLVIVFVVIKLAIDLMYHKQEHAQSKIPQ